MPRRARARRRRPEGPTRPPAGPVRPAPARRASPRGPGVPARARRSGHRSAARPTSRTPSCRRPPSRPRSIAAHMVGRVKAAVVHEPGPPEVLRVEARPVPEARDGWIVVGIHAFGLNRSELVTRRGGSGNAVAFPRVLGIEAVGEVVEDPSGELEPGQTFVAAMGGMGRAFDGGYEQYALLP